MELQARLSHNRLNYTQDNVPHLVVSLRAPVLGWREASWPALCIVPAIDTSGSMAGPKLQFAKESLLKLVDQLTPSAIMGLVGFGSRASVLVKPGLTSAEHKDRLREAIHRLQAQGGTDICDGMLQSLSVIESLDLGARYRKRVILFTDGHANEGVTDQAAILHLLGQRLGDMTVSAFGYGSEQGIHGSCDQQFLTNLAQDGRGNYAYVQNPDDALTAFGRELGGLMSTYAQDITVEIEPLQGHQVSQPITNIKVEQDALGAIEFNIPSILSEEVRNFVFDTKILKQDTKGQRPANVFNVKVQYQVLTSEGRMETKAVETEVQAQFVPAGDEQKVSDPDLDSAIALAQVIRGQLLAEEFAKKGDYAQAVSIMRSVDTSLVDRGLLGPALFARSVGSRMGNAASYESSQGYLRSTAGAGTRAYGVSAMDSEAEAQISAVNVSMGNSSMNTSTHTFNNTEGTDVPVPEACSLPVFTLTTAPLRKV